MRLLDRLRGGERSEAPRFDPGRERRAERRGRELMRGIAPPEALAMYEQLGFVAVERDGYGYLLYPHRPIVAYATDTGELLNEYCVGFPDSEGGPWGSRLPDADDVLAKWISLSADERGLISKANMHLPGRQVDPTQARRDLAALRAWRTSRAPGGSA